MARKNKIEDISTNTQVDTTVVLLKEMLKNSEEMLKNSEEIKNILLKLKERFI